MDNKQTILIIDDDPNLTKTLSDIIRLQGYAPLVAAKGKTALDKVNGISLAVALIDLKLPDMNGLEVMREIKKRSPHTECIVLTGYGSRASAIEAVNLGAYGYMQKPYDVEQLVLTIRRAVEKGKAEEATKLAYAQLDQIFNTAGGGMRVVDKDFNVVRINETFSSLSGISKDEAVGKKCYEVLPGPTCDTPNCPLTRILGGDQRVEYDVEKERSDGTRIPCIATATPFRGSGGELIGIVEDLKDITERKRAEEEIVRLAKFPSENPSPVLRVAKDGTILYGNSSSLPLLNTWGCQEGQSLPDHWRKFTSDVLSSGSSKDAEVELEDRILSLTFAPVVDADYVNVYALDITQRKRADEELQRTLEKLRKALGGTIQAMALTVEARDPYTAGHQRRATNLARAIATEMGLSEEQIDGIRMAGVVHDLGKISVPAGILNKPGRLTKNEFAIIQTHPQVAYDILKTIEFPWPVAQIVHEHHERIDGSGYPAGLKGEEIMLEARILAVADVVEAMCSHRPYRPAWSIDEALGEIRQNRGVLYDPEVVDACLSLFGDEGFELGHA